MLSILIPIYNFKIVDVVRKLAKQAENAQVAFEILCFDDGSTEQYRTHNESLIGNEHITYHELTENIGRTKIRNLLAQKAKYKNLLFLDCDIRIDKENFINNYLQHINGHVICGGVAYDTKKPKKEAFLRWKYGRKREEKSASFRNQSPYQSFTACNMLISKKVMLIHAFNEELTQYGHEDTLLGIELKKAGITVAHIDNPIIHLGLDSCLSFIKKTESGLDNLMLLINKGKIGRDIKLYRHYQFWKKTLFLSRIPFNMAKNTSRKKLLNGNASLFWFDLYKLSYLLTLKKD